MEKEPLIGIKGLCASSVGDEVFLAADLFEGGFFEMIYEGHVDFIVVSNQDTGKFQTKSFEVVLKDPDHVIVRILGAQRKTVEEV